MSGTVVAIGGGGLSRTRHGARLREHLLSLTRSSRRPRVCFVPTASGDAASLTREFGRAFPGTDSSVLSLFRREPGDLRRQVLSQDLVYVGGGSTANLLAVWRLHGLDEVLREAHGAGVVLAGWSAGMNCWFQGSVTDSFGPELQPLADGLGMLEGSACPHYDGEQQRRPTYLSLVGSGALPPGYAVDDHCALVFRDTVLDDVVSARDGARAFRVAREGGTAVEHRLDVTPLSGGGARGRGRLRRPAWLQRSRS